MEISCFKLELSFTSLIATNLQYSTTHLEEQKSSSPFLCLTAVLWQAEFLHDLRVGDEVLESFTFCKTHLK